mgnify:CR=1 FL=1
MSIWVSSFVQIGGSRIVFLVIENVVPQKISSIYYILLRLVEGLLFIPNNICAEHFKKIINNKKNSIFQLDLRNKMLISCLISSLIVSPILYFVFLAYINFKGINIESNAFMFTLVFILVIISFLRIWISREIVINDNLISSPISYFASFICTIPAIYFLSKYGFWVIFSLLVYYVIATITPLIVNSKKMNSTKDLLKKTLCLKTL